jgi:putative transposase
LTKWVTEGSHSWKHNQRRKIADRPRSNREANAAKSELLDQLLAQCSEGEDFFGPDGVFTKLKGAVMERLLQAELAQHLEQLKGPDGEQRNGRNGYSDKTVQTETGPVRVSVPRDRNGSFEPPVVKKHQRRVQGFDEKVLALYARGMTTRDIQGHLQELYGTEVSHELISKATDAIMPQLREWQARPLDPVYAVTYLDALFVSVRDGVQVQKRAFFVALGVKLDGKRDVLNLAPVSEPPELNPPRLARPSGTGVLVAGPLPPTGASPGTPLSPVS